MAYLIKKPETEAELMGRAEVHWRGWQEAYPGLVSQSFLDALTPEKCQSIARSNTEGVLIAKDAGRVIGFVAYGDRGEEAPDTGEVFALYVLREYYGKGVGQLLMHAALEQLQDYPQVCLWVLKENRRAIRFYEKCGFRPTGEELYSARIEATEQRMLLTKL